MNDEIMLKLHAIKAALTVAQNMGAAFLFNEIQREETMLVEASTKLVPSRNSPHSAYDGAKSALDITLKNAPATTPSPPLVLPPSLHAQHFRFAK